MATANALPGGAPQHRLAQRCANAHRLRPLPPARRLPARTAYRPMASTSAGAWLASVSTCCVRGSTRRIWSRLASSGTTPPYAWCMAIWLYQGACAAVAAHPGCACALSPRRFRRGGSNPQHGHLRVMAGSVMRRRAKPAPPTRDTGTVPYFQTQTGDPMLIASPYWPA